MPHCHYHHARASTALLQGLPDYLGMHARRGNLLHHFWLGLLLWCGLVLDRGFPLRVFEHGICQFSPCLWLGQRGASVFLALPSLGEAWRTPGSRQGPGQHHPWGWSRLQYQSWQPSFATWLNLSVPLTSGHWSLKLPFRLLHVWSWPQRACLPSSVASACASWSMNPPWLACRTPDSEDSHRDLWQRHQPLWAHFCNSSDFWSEDRWLDDLCGWDHAPLTYLWFSWDSGSCALSRLGDWCSGPSLH